MTGLEISNLHNHLKQFFILKVEDALHPNSEGLLTELDAELFRHLVRVERILGGVLLVEEIHLNNDRGQVMLLRIELIRSHINFLSITKIIILLLRNSFLVGKGFFHVDFISKLLYSFVEFFFRKIHF